MGTELSSPCNAILDGLRMDPIPLERMEPVLDIDILIVYIWRGITVVKLSFQKRCALQLLLYHVGKRNRRY